MEFLIETQEKQQLIDVTEEVNAIILQKKIKEGICNVFIKHATAALIINENADPNICIDFLKALNGAFPEHGGYLHDDIDNNAGAHIKAAVLGASETIPIKNGALDLGTWQSVMVVELDGPRKRKINVEVI
ncbi:secondary thiamine-phosphate synthase enzyme YjbQ [Nanoarchaeota archaeon]